MRLQIRDGFAKSCAWLRCGEDNPQDGWRIPAFRKEQSGSFHTLDHFGSPRQSLWSFTVEQVQRMTGETHAREAAVALWALLHGAATLEAGQVHGENKPASGFEFGLNAWLLLAETPSSTSRTKKAVRSPDTRV